MNHPSDEKWVPYLCGEATPEEQNQLAEHLRDCPQCASLLQSWQRTARKLESLTFPARISCGRVRYEPVLKWGLAAALVLGLGFALGRATTLTRADLDDLRVQLRQQLRQEMVADSQTALDQVRQQFSDAIAAAESRVGQAANTEAGRIWRGFMEVLSRAREEDRRATAALVQALQQQHDADFVSLHTDVETVASHTDEGIREARLKLIQLATCAEPNDESQSTKH
jgi:anti-sigma factor RsiW